MKNRYKRLTALVMACAMVFLQGEGLAGFGLKAAAAGGVQLQVEDTGEGLYVTSTLAGDQVPFKLVAPAGTYVNIHSMIATKTGAADTAIEKKIGFDNISSPTKPVITIASDILEGNIKGEESYDVRFKLFATSDTGNMNESYPNEATLPPADAKPPTYPPLLNHAAGEFTLANVDKINTASTIKIKCTTGQTAADHMPSFEVDPSVPAAGDFVGMTQVSGITNSLKKEPNGNITLSVRFTGASGSKEMKATFTSAQKLILRGSEFTFSFPAAETNKLTIKVTSAQGLVDGIHKKVISDELHGQYITFKPGDTYNSISSDSFSLATKYLGFSGKGIINIGWEWKQTDPLPAPTTPESQVVRIPTKDMAGDKNPIQAIVSPQENQVVGFLYPTVTYVPASGSGGANSHPVTEGTFPGLGGLELTILGNGLLPTVTAESQIIRKGVEVPIAPVPPATSTPFPSILEMDYYDGASDAFLKPNEFPYVYSGFLWGGTKNKQSTYATIKIGNPDILTIEYSLEDGLWNPYTSGDKITFKETDFEQAKVKYRIKAVNTESPAALRCALTFNFLKDVKGLKDPLTLATVNSTVMVYDNSPNENTTLASMQITQYLPGTGILGNLVDDEDEYKDLAFTPETRAYKDVKLNYKVKSIAFKVVKGNMLQKKITMKVDNEPEVEVQTGRKTAKIELQESVPRKIVFTITSESGKTGTYELVVERQFPSEDATLKELKVHDSVVKDAPEIPITPAFAPKTQEYKLDVLYKVDKIQISTLLNDKGATIVSIEPSIPGESEKEGVAANQWVPLVYETDANGLLSNNVTKIEVKTQAEDETTTALYVINVTRGSPDKNPDLSSLAVTGVTTDATGTAAAPAVALKPGFNKDTLTYSVEIPYTTEKIKIKAKPVFAEAKMVANQGTTKLMDLESDVESKAIAIDFATDAAPFYQVDVEVTAEDGVTKKIYKLEVTRKAPSDDASLSNIVVNGVTATVTPPPTTPPATTPPATTPPAAGGSFTLDPNFHTETKRYTVEVPFTTDKVTVLPTPTVATVSSITVGGKKIEIGKASSNIKLDYPGSTDIEIVVTAENKTTQSTYVVSVKRKTPGTDARLKSLVLTGTSEFKPIFVPSKLEYTATVAEGEKGVTITATPNDPLASLTINGEKVANGVASPLIEILEIKQTIEIVVTAEDGTTTMTYTITFTNENLIEKSANADLKSLKVVKGEMEPKFKPSTTTYEVYTTESTFDVDLFPVAADSLAKIQVFAGTLEIGDNKGNYSQSIIDGQNDFQVKVTSPDGKVIKNYNIAVFRNEEGKMGNLTPLRAEDIDFENSPDVITVDITKRPRIGADVFAELKNYPEKTIVFQGNDYSLQFAAKDLTKIIPMETVYDFGMTFSSPLEDKIMSEIGSYSGNSKSKPVILDFNYHGELPGKATFTMSLGNKYGNKKLFFHYFNEERNRLDYYGYVQTNSKGTFSVSLDRLGAFVITSDKRLDGSENKALGDSQAQGTDLGKTEAVTGNKINPNTGVLPGKER